MYILDKDHSKIKGKIFYTSFQHKMIKENMTNKDKTLSPDFEPRYTRCRYRELGILLKRSFYSEVFKSKWVKRLLKRHFNQKSRINIPLLANMTFHILSSQVPQLTHKRVGEPD